MARLRLALTRKYAVYIDLTEETQPRPYYVGKGTTSRVNKRWRSRFHQTFVRRFGHQRRVVFETDVASEAYAKERELIALHRTYAHGGEGWWGANLDLGGEGGPSTPKTEQHRERIRAALSGRPKSPQHRQAMS